METKEQEEFKKYKPDAGITELSEEGQRAVEIVAGYTAAIRHKREELATAEGEGRERLEGEIKELAKLSQELAKQHGFQVT